MLESTIFIFVTKPYAVGDVISLKGHGALTVKSLQLLHTTFDTLENKRCIIPNHILAGSTITNLHHSANAVFRHKFTIGSGTPPNLIWKLETRLKRYCVRSSDWLASPRIFIGGYAETATTSGLALTIVTTSTHAWADGSIWKAKTEILAFFIEAFQELGLDYEQPLQPVRMVDPAQDSRERERRRDEYERDLNAKKKVLQPVLQKAFARRANRRAEAEAEAEAKAEAAAGVDEAAAGASAESKKRA